MTAQLRSVGRPPETLKLGVLCETMSAVSTRTMENHFVGITAFVVAALGAVDPAWAQANLADSPCAGHTKGFQVYGKFCLEDKLVGYIECVNHLGGNRLRVTQSNASQSGSDVKVQAEGKGEGIIIKAAGQAGVDVKNVDDVIRKIDVMYGGQAVNTCMEAAGIKRSPGPVRGRTSRQNRQRVVESAAAKGATGNDQDVEVGTVVAESKGRITVGKSTQGGSSTKQKVKTGDIKVSNESQAEIGVIDQPTANAGQAAQK